MTTTQMTRNPTLITQTLNRYIELIVQGALRVFGVFNALGLAVALRVVVWVIGSASLQFIIRQGICFCVMSARIQKCKGCFDCFIREILGRLHRRASSSFGSVQYSQDPFVVK